MKKFTSILLLLLMCIGASWAQVLPVAGKFYRIKDVANSKYLTIQNYDVHDKGANGGVSVSDELPTNPGQIWEFESTGNANEYKIKSKSGYYIKLREWNVDAAPSDGSVITIEEATDVFYMKWTNTFKNNSVCYFKVGASESGGGLFPYGDADDSGKASWCLVEFNSDAEVAAWKNAQFTVLGYVGGYDKSMQSDIEKIKDVLEIETFVLDHETVQPVDGGYYFVKTANNQSAGQGMYMSYTGTDCRVYQLGDGEKPGIQHVWQFDAPADGGFKLKSCNLGAYLQTGVAPAASTIVADMDNGYKYNFIVNAGAEITIKDGNDKVLRTEGSSENYKVNQWTNNTDATWYIIPAEDIYVTLSAEDTKGAWATAYLPFGVDLPAKNLKAYAVTATENGSATLTEVPNIPANQGVILSGTAGEHHLTINKNVAWSGVDNKLRGTNVSTSVSEAAYVLAKPETEVGLYKAAMTDGAWTNNGNKAYLPASEVAAGAPFLIFDFGTETAIEGVAAKDAGKAVIYDLSGRRVKSAQKGIYIINGKKVVK